jgi:hypothetical protein
MFVGTVTGELPLETQFHSLSASELHHDTTSSSVSSSTVFLKLASRAQELSLERVLVPIRLFQRSRVGLRREPQLQMSGTPFGIDKCFKKVWLESRHLSSPSLLSCLAITL